MTIGVPLLPAGYSIESSDPRSVDDRTMLGLHALANTMASEPYAHFLEHAHDNDVLYVFRGPDGEEAGFQFWKTFGEPGPVRYALGGKLRVRPEARRKGLHVAAGLALLHRERRAHPDARVRRLAIVNPFGFASLVRRLARWEWVGPGANEAIHPIVARECEGSGFRFDPTTGLAHVGITPTAGQIAAYPESFWSSELVRSYLAKNPRYREDGTNLVLVFDADDDNLEALGRSLRERAPR